MPDGEGDEESTSLIEKALKLPQYAGATLMVVVSIGAFAVGGFFSGIIWLFSALLLIPTTRDRILKTLKSAGLPSLPRGSLAVVVLIGVIIGAVAYPGVDETDSQPTVQDSTTTIESTPVTSTSTVSTTSATTTTTRITTTSTTTTQSGPQTQWTVTVVSVTGGDTMDVRMPDGSTETIRLLGVDTPETSVGSTSPTEWEGIADTADGRDWLAEWGDSATSYANERLSVGSEIYIETDPQADRRGSYGRLLVYAFQSESADTSFNLRLIQNGYARMYDSQFSKRSDFENAESLAQDSETGVWDYSAPEPTTTTDSGSESGNLVVASVHADASGNDHENLDDEYITLRNNGDAPLDMGGWSVSDAADHTYYVPSGFTLEAGESVTIYTGSGSDSDSELYWGSDSAIWNNGGDTIIVEDGGETILTYEYS